MAIPTLDGTASGTYDARKGIVSDRGNRIPRQARKGAVLMNLDNPGTSGGEHGLSFGYF